VIWGTPSLASLGAMAVYARSYTAYMQEFDYDLDGFVIYRELIPSKDVDSYCEFMDKQFFSKGIRSRDDDYTRHPEMRNLLCHEKLADKCFELGLSGGVEATLANWFYEEVGWHTDRMGSMPREFGVFFSLDYLPPESGRFAIYAGSHRWGLDLDQCTPGYRGDTNPYLLEVLNNTVEKPYYFDGNKGDVLIWDAESVHRRTEKTNDAIRKSAVTLCAKREGLMRHGNGWYYTAT